jgi:hypothetical protein
MQIYEVRPRSDHRGVDLISDVLPFGRRWYDTPDHAIGYERVIVPNMTGCRKLI